MIRRGKLALLLNCIGVVLYEGPSVLTGDPIVVLATFNTANTKTGNLIQTWIMRSDVHPLEAIKTGADEAVCWMCPHKGVGGKNRSCYVNMLFGPNKVWTSYKNGRYDKYTDDYAPLFQGNLLRAGAYGDPVAAPIEVWNQVLPLAASTTSYTHMWELVIAERFKAWTMASVDTISERVTAKAKGWRTYRVDNGAGLQPGEVWCPASEPGGMRAQCEDCMGCDGLTRGSKRVDFVTPPHSRGATHFDVWSLAKEMQQLENYNE